LDPLAYDPRSIVLAYRRHPKEIFQPAGRIADSPLLLLYMRNKQSQLEQLLLSHLDAAYNVAYWLMQNDPDAQRVVQKAFEQACKEFGKHADVRRCLLAFVLRGAHAWIRQGSQPDGRSPAEPVLETHGQAGPEILSRALRKLPPELREVLVLHELEGWSYQEIAAALEIPQTTVAARLSHARHCLRKELQPAAIGAQRLNVLLSCD
jgi:RNA polymerase sigma factor (sigma-70 family)